jgi:hypothetical protein
MTNNIKSISFWKLSDRGQLFLDDKTAGTYVSKQIGLEARKICVIRALATFTNPVIAVGNQYDD